MSCERVELSDQDQDLENADTFKMVIEFPDFTPLTDPVMIAEVEEFIKEIKE
jgi:hypothetical protein